MLVANAFAKRPQSLASLCHCTSALCTSMCFCCDCIRSAASFCVWVSRDPCRLSYTLMVKGLQPTVDTQIQWQFDLYKYSCLWFHGEPCPKKRFLEASYVWALLVQERLCGSDDGVIELDCKIFLCSIVRETPPHFRPVDVNSFVSTVTLVAAVGDIGTLTQVCCGWQCSDLETRGKAKKNLDQWSTTCRIHLYPL